MNRKDFMKALEYWRKRVLYGDLIACGLNRPCNGLRSWKSREDFIDNSKYLCKMELCIPD